MVGPYIGGRRRRLKGMKEGVVLPAQWRPVCRRRRNAACLPHICRGTVPNFEIGEQALTFTREGVTECV